MKLCPLCKSIHLELIYQSTLTKPTPTLNQYLCTSSSYGLHGPIYKCLNCSLVFVVDNAPIKSILNRYQQAQDPLYLAEEAGRIKTFGRHLKILNRLQNPPGKLLDIGTYTGLFPFLAQKSGWRVWGLEPSKWAVLEAKKKYGLEIKLGLLKPGLFKPNSFDAVTLWDVIEHFTDPFEAVKTCHSYLKPGAVLALTTIDVDSLAAKALGHNWPWYMRMHRVYFSKPTIRRLLESAGFKILFFTPHIRYISLRYLASRFKKLDSASQFLAKNSIGDFLLPFYIGDLFDVYAKKG